MSSAPVAKLRARTKFFLPRDGLEKWGAEMRCLGAVPKKQGSSVCFETTQSGMTRDISGVTVLQTTGFSTDTPAPSRPCL